MVAPFQKPGSRATEAISIPAAEAFVTNLPASRVRPRRAQLKPYSNGITRSSSPKTLVPRLQRTLKRS